MPSCTGTVVVKVTVDVVYGAFGSLTASGTATDRNNPVTRASGSGLWRP